MHSISTVDWCCNITWDDAGSKHVSIRIQASPSDKNRERSFKLWRKTSAESIIHCSDTLHWFPRCDCPTSMLEWSCEIGVKFTLRILANFRSADLACSCSLVKFAAHGSPIAMLANATMFLFLKLLTLLWRPSDLWSGQYVMKMMLM